MSLFNCIGGVKSHFQRSGVLSQEVEKAGEGGNGVEMTLFLSELMLGIVLAVVGT